MKKVELRMKEQEKYETIKEYVDHGGNKNKIALKLSISRRQVDRLIIKYKEKGKSAFIHANRGQVPAKALDKSIFEDIILLYQSKYQGWNFNHFKDFLEKEENIKVSYDLIYKTLTRKGFLSLKLERKPNVNMQRKSYLMKRKLILL